MVEKQGCPIERASSPLRFSGSATAISTRHGDDSVPDRRHSRYAFADESGAAQAGSPVITR